MKRNLSFIEKNSNLNLSFVPNKNHDIRLVVKKSKNKPPKSTTVFCENIFFLLNYSF